MIKDGFFVENSYKVHDINENEDEDKTQGRGLPPCCWVMYSYWGPIRELKQIIDGLDQEGIALKYPAVDAKLQVEILEQTYGPPDE